MLPGIMTVVATVTALVIMARKKGGLHRRSVLGSVTLGALTDQTTLGATLTGTVDRPLRVERVALSGAIKNLTSGQGPIYVGIAHGSYTDAEIEEWIEQSTHLDFADLKDLEILDRKCFLLGVFSGATADEVLNDGRKVSMQTQIPLESGQQLRLWAHNVSGGTLTTGAAIVLFGDIWIRKD